MKFNVSQVPLKYQNGREEKSSYFFKAMLANRPRNKFFCLSGGKFADEAFEGILTAINQN